jgi:hypothetical protein
VGLVFEAKHTHSIDNRDLLIETIDLCSNGEQVAKEKTQKRIKGNTEWTVLAEANDN